MNGIDLTQAGILRPYVACLERRGIDADRYLARARIPRPFIDMGHAPIPRRNGAWRFLEDVERGEGIETFGFFLGDPLDLSDLGPFGRKLQSAATLREAAGMAQRFMSHFVQGNRARLRFRDGSLWITCCSGGEVCRPADQGCLVLLLEVVRMVAGPEWMPPRASLQSGPVDVAGALPGFARCELLFDRDFTGVPVPAGFLEAAIHPGAGEAAPDPPALPSSGRLSDSIQAVVETSLPFYGPPSAAEAADLLGTSRATLFRRLSAEDVTYAEIVERTRFQAAQRLLQSRSFSVKEVAYLLGYSAPSNFIRAFRNRAGVTPSLFREVGEGV